MMDAKGAIVPLALIAAIVLLAIYGEETWEDESYHTPEKILTDPASWNDWGSDPRYGPYS